MKRENIFRALVVAAALILQGAALAAPAQSKKAARKKAASTSASAEPAPGSTAATPDASPAPVKLNRREPAPEQKPAPPANANPGGAAKAERSATAVRYSYEFNQPAFLVSRIVIEHDAQGRGQVSFRRRDAEELYTDPLEISPAALARITAAWEALKFLDSETNYQADKQFPHLGTMTLKMREGARERKAEFNWTHDAQAEALVKEYRRIGEQQLFVFDVTIARQYQPSDTVKIFKRLESLLNRDELSDTLQLVPLLRDLTTDERIPLMARNHATRLLKKIEK